MTRRELMLAAGSATLIAQAQTPQQAPPIPANPDEELAAVREAQRRAADALAKVNLPMSTEPAVHFKA